MEKHIATYLYMLKILTTLCHFGGDCRYGSFAKMVDQYSDGGMIYANIPKRMSCVCVHMEKMSFSLRSQRHHLLTI